MVKVIGITGGFGSGKTFVASMFGKLGAKVIDADRIAHEVIRKGSPEYKRIVKLFGKGIISRNGEIDRKKLGAIVFSRPKLLSKLNRIVHPEVIRRIKSEIVSERVSGLAGERVIVIDAPLLIEAGLDKLVDKLVVVKCQKRRQIERCQEKFCLQKEEISQRIASQIPLKKKIQMADLTIDNSRTRALTEKQVRKAWREKLWK